MIVYVEGNLFDSPARVLVNAVNTMGVMGRGVAKQFRDIYPDMYEAYRRACARKELPVGGLMMHRTPNKTILNFPTKRHWRYPSKVEYIEAGLRTFVECYEQLGLSSVAFPQLGCGTGGLDWKSEVHPLMESYLKDLPIITFVYIYRPIVGENRRSTDERLSRPVAKPSPMTFGEAWSTFISAVQWGTVCAGDVQLGWSVESSDEGEALVLHGEDRDHHLDRRAMFDMWKLLGTQGFLLPCDLPGELRDSSAKLFATLSQLGWADRAILATQEQDLGSTVSQGVLWAEPASKPSRAEQALLFH